MSDISSRKFELYQSRLQTPEERLDYLNERRTTLLKEAQQPEVKNNPKYMQQLQTEFNEVKREIVAATRELRQAQNLQKQKENFHKKIANA